MRERGAMIRHNRFAAFLILLLLLSTFVAVSHFHNDTADRHDCPICIVSYHQQATSQSEVAFDGIPCFTETTVVALSPVFIDDLLFFSLNNRAPPA
jgi:hypothetical protein